MGPCMYYQHESLKFSAEVDQASRDLMAQQLMKELHPPPGISSVFECLCRFYPDDNQKIKELDYEGKIPVECYLVFHHR